MRIVIDTQNPNNATTRTDTTGPLANAGSATVTAQLHKRLSDSLPGSFLQGKTRMRNEVMDMLSCSAVRAERIVDTLVAGGHARFEKPPKNPAIDPRVGQWHLQP